jgi:hypothetical protein
VKREPQIGTPEFNALKAEWDQKLAEDGFDDIERPPSCRAGPDPTLPPRQAASGSAIGGMSRSRQIVARCLRRRRVREGDVPLVETKP